MKPIKLIIATMIITLSTAFPIAETSAKQPEPTLTEQQQRQARYLYDQLRCMVCDSQTIASSQAELAIDMRQKVRSLVREGRSDAQILDYFTQRYGQVVLLNPPIRPNTLPLWLAPLIILTLASLIAGVYVMRGSKVTNDSATV